MGEGFFVFSETGGEDLGDVGDGCDEEVLD
jgi:hypothetical protein